MLKLHPGEGELWLLMAQAFSPRIPACHEEGLPPGWLGFGRSGNCPCCFVGPQNGVFVVAKMGQERGCWTSVFSPDGPDHCWAYTLGSAEGMCLLSPERKKVVAQLCPTLCDPMDCSPPGSSVRGILQARMLEWSAISFYRGSFRPRD